MTRLDDLPMPNSPQGAPGYSAGKPGVAAQEMPAERLEDFEDELFWNRPRSFQGRQQRRGQQVNVGNGERSVSVAAGAIIGLLGLSRKSIPGLLGVAVGGAMIYRGVTGSCPMYRAMGLNTAEPSEGEAEGLESLHNGIHITTAFGIRKSPEELYSFWRNFENLPRIMTHLESVRVLDNRRSHWVAKAPAGTSVEWDAEIINDEPNALIAWRSLGGADVDNAGSVRFVPTADGSATDVKVVIDYIPPAGRLGSWIASLFGENPEQQLTDDLQRFKDTIESGSSAARGA